MTTSTALGQEAVVTGPPAALPTRRRKLPPARILAQVLLYVLLIAIAIIYIFPFLVQVSTAFKTDAEATSDPISLIPATITYAAFERLFTRSDFPLWFANSTVVTLLVTLGRVFLVSLAGYALARLHFRGRGFVFAMVVAVMAVRPSSC